MPTRKQWIIAPVAAGAAVLIGSKPGFARIIVNTIDPTATLSARGRIADGAALIACSEGERIDVTLTLTQGDVIGEGRTHGECTGELTPYPVRVVARGPADFQPGTAEACATAVDSARGKFIDSREWCREAGVDLEED